ncbi:MAG: hypothetical protein AAFN07_04075 [Pseudomonadota bacterium]
MKCVNIVVGLIAAFAVCCSDAEAQFYDQESEIVDEIISVGTRPAGFDFGSLGGWLSWSILDIGDLNGDLNNLGNSLQNFLDAANEASEEQCRQRVEDWRSRCHTQMNVNHGLCIASSMFLLGAPIRALIPRAYQRASNFGAGLVGGSRCAGWNARAHMSCDAIADSDAAPRIAQCDGR